MAARSIGVVKRTLVMRFLVKEMTRGRKLARWSYLKLSILKVQSSTTVTRPAT